MNHNLPDVSISSSDTKLKRVHRVWMDAVKRDSTILQLCLTQSEKVSHLYEHVSTNYHNKGPKHFFFTNYGQNYVIKLKRGEEGL